MVTAKPRKSPRARATKAAPEARPQVTTIRLDEAVQKGLQVLEAHSGVKRPLNKWVNIALAALIDRQAATLERELDQALRNIKAYRKTDPGYRRAIRAFIDAEVAFAANHAYQPVVKVVTAFDRRCIPAVCVARPSNMLNTFSPRAWSAGRITGLGARQHFHHGLLW